MSRSTDTDDRARRGREHDLVLYGATGYVGRLIAAELARAAPAGTRIVLAGRDRRRLAEGREELGDAGSGWAVTVADAADEAGLDRLARSATALLTTVGPYSHHGLPVAAACAQAGTHYADLTGELPFYRRLVDELDATARDTGARLVPSCGYDAVPSDLGMLALHEAVAAAGEGPLREATLVARLRGGLSGGTLASLGAVVDAASRDREVRRLLLDPYALSPNREDEPDLGRQLDLSGPTRSRELGGWVAPFAMASFDTRVVRRSNTLLGHAYGRDLRYREVMGVGGRVPALNAAAVTAGLSVGAAAFAVRPLRHGLARLLPAPGQGPSETARRRGYFRSTIHAVTESGSRWTATVAAAGDPGYQATSVLAGQAVLALALDGDLPDASGVVTTAVGLGLPYAARLRAAGVTVEAARS